MKFKKFNPLKNDVIIIDGISGTGKSLIGPIISGMKGVEKQRQIEAFPMILLLQKSNKISEDACSFIINNTTDFHQYNSLIGREINLRWYDDSGIKNNPNVLRYIKRIFSSNEGSSIVHKINSKNLALNIFTNDVIFADDLLFKNLGDRLKMIQMVRHPLYMIKHWESFYSRYEQTRIFNLSVDYKGNKLPWFIQHDEDYFLSLNHAERAIFTIEHLYNRLFKSLDNHKYKNQILCISFEECCMNIYSILDKLENFLDRSHSRKIDNILKKQKLPRQLLNRGKGLKKYGFKKSTFSSEEDEYNFFFNSYQEVVNPALISKLETCIDKYNKHFPSILSRF
jgi:hypothetical protein